MLGFVCASYNSVGAEPLEVPAEVETVPISEEDLQATEGLAGCGCPVVEHIVDFGAVGEDSAREREGVHGF
ncbi:unnamed protein product [Schistocephalus solidus]|uniref:Ferredoxin n=1 Tax=Schistocephalus solidus TaxID=70667 RepID=A0A183SXT8_SCHSO|nr:unnamed protein product [Schistocephalus solidus]